MVQRSLLFTVIALLTALSAQVASSQQLDLDTVVALALANNPDIEVARQQQRAGEGLLTQSRAAYLPQLSATAGIGAAQINDLQPEDQDSVASLTLSASQLLYDFNRTTGLIEASSFSLAAASANLLQVQHDVVLDTKIAFYGVLEAQRLVTVAEEAVANYEQQLYRAKRYFDAGVRTRIDVTNAEVNLANQRLNLLRANANVKSGRVRLEQVMGTRPQNGNYTIATAGEDLAQLVSSPPAMPGKLTDLLTTARDQRPGLKRLSLFVESAEAALRASQGEYWPTIAASTRYQQYETELSSLPDQWQVGITAEWQIFSGFATEGKVVESRAQLREAAATLQAAGLAVDQEVTDSFVRAEENREAIDIATQALMLARENLDLAERRYQNGLGDLLEFNDAQLLLTRNQSDLVIAYYAYLSSLARLERATGSMALEEMAK